MQIHDKAVLVKLSIGMPGNTRKDPNITDEVKASHSLGDKAGRWMKQLYPNEALEPLSKLASESRTWHYKHSLPWTDEGWRILPAAHHFDYTSKMRKYRQDYEHLSETHFIRRLDEWVEWAKQQHNGTFDEADYLTAELLRKKFGFSTEFQPVPSGDDFRVSLAHDEVEAMSLQVNTRVAEAVMGAQSDLWSRLITPVAAMVERLSDPENKFKDSLVENIHEIVGLIPALNLTGDQKLEDFRQQVEKELAGYSPDVLRRQQNQRAQAADKAKAILEKMKGYAI